MKISYFFGFGVAGTVVAGLVYFKLAADLTPIAIDHSPAPAKVDNANTPLAADVKLATEKRDDFDLVSARQRLLHILTIDDDTERLAQLNALFLWWMPVAPRRAIDVIDSLSQTDVKPLLFEIALRIWSRENPLAFDRWLDDVAPDARFDMALFNLVLDPITPESSAIVWAQKISNVGLSQKALQSVILRWVKRDPDEAVAWALYEPDRQPIVAVIFGAISALDPEQALLTYSLLSGASVELINEVLNAMSHFMDPSQVNEGTIIALETVTDNRLRKMAWDQLLPILATSENRLSIAEIIRDSEASSSRNIMQSAFISIWAQEEPKTAAEFALTTAPGEDGQDYAIKGAIDAWSQQDLQASSDWLASMYGDIDSDLAAASFSYNATDHPDTLPMALQWNARIDDDTERARAIKITVNHWFNYDEDGAIAYLREQHIIPQEQEAAYIKDLRENKAAMKEAEIESDIANDQ